MGGGKPWIFKWDRIKEWEYSLPNGSNVMQIFDKFILQIYVLSKYLLIDLSKYISHGAKNESSFLPSSHESLASVHFMSSPRLGTSFPTQGSPSLVEDTGMSMSDHITLCQIHTVRRKNRDQRSINESVMPGSWRGCLNCLERHTGTNEMEERWAACLLQREVGVQGSIFIKTRHRL